MWSSISGLPMQKMRRLMFLGWTYPPIIDALKLVQSSISRGVSGLIKFSENIPAGVKFYNCIPAEKKYYIRYRNIVAQKRKKGKEVRTRRMLGSSPGLLGLFFIALLLIYSSNALYEGRGFWAAFLRPGEYNPPRFHWDIWFVIIVHCQSVLIVHCQNELLA